MSGDRTAVWKSVNEALVNNRCWLCQEVFRRGRGRVVFRSCNCLADPLPVKKTFTFLQLIAFLSESDPHAEPENESLRICWKEFAELDRDVARLRQSLADASIEDWCVPAVAAPSEWFP